MLPGKPIFIFFIYIYMYIYVNDGVCRLIQGQPIENLGGCKMLNFPGGSEGKASVYKVGDLGSIPGSGRSTGKGNGKPLQYYCLENSMDRGAW